MNHGLAYSANISIMFKEVPLRERAARARAAGFRHVESWWPFAGPQPSAAETDEFVDAIGDAGVTLTGLNFYAGDMPAGERGVACRPERRGEFDQSLPVLRRIAERTGCLQFNCLYGQYDAALSRQAQDEVAVSALAAAAATVAPLGGTVLLEPLAAGLNGEYPLVDGDDVVAVIDGPLAAAGVTNVALLFDVFHLGSNGVDLVAAATRLGGHTGHVQLADAPGRHEPGTGSLPIAETVSALVAAGYSGYLGCEYAPLGTTEEGLGWLDLTPAVDERHHAKEDRE